MKKILGILVLSYLLVGCTTIETKKVKSDSIKIVDGDTIVLNGEKIRFSGIDAPELKQTCMKDDQKVFCGMFVKMLLIKKIGWRSIFLSLDY